MLFDRRIELMNQISKLCYLVSLKFCNSITSLYYVIGKLKVVIINNVILP